MFLIKGTGVRTGPSGQLEAQDFFICFFNAHPKATLL